METTLLESRSGSSIPLFLKKIQLKLKLQCSFQLTISVLFLLLLLLCMVFWIWPPHRSSQETRDQINNLRNETEEMRKTLEDLVDSLKVQLVSLESEVAVLHPHACPTGWLLHQALCFKQFNQSLSFAEASAACKRENSSLPLVRSHQANVIVAMVLGRKWIGLASRGGFPSTLTISSTGPASSAQNDKMGRYAKVPGRVRNGQPVWRHQDTEEEFVFLNDNHHWLVGPNYTANDGGIYDSSSRDGIIDSTGWKYLTDDSEWVADIKMRVVGNGPWEWLDGSSMTYSNWNEKSPSSYRVSGSGCAVMEESGRWTDVACTATERFSCTKDPE